ncbi:MAG: hypothetical protein EBU90_30155 [Proteobacteria bacterium]|nr:hypothetical protein [Pseudomonadota bacterium]
MQYFDTLPKIISTDANKVSMILTNLVARCSIVPKILSNPLVYYEYDIQEGDTPEIVAHKYYDDMYRYWIILLANKISDPQWDWPLDSNNFNRYMQDKYPSIDPKSVIQHYEKIITQVDNMSRTTTTTTVIIDEDTYNTLVESTNTYNLPSGSVTVSVQKNAVSVYDYEVSLNESKRKIKIVNYIYANQLEEEFTKLMT